MTTDGSHEVGGRLAGWWWPAVAALAIVYALGVNNQWAITPDGSLYVTLGRALAEGRGMEYNGGQWWAVPPLLPLLVAACRLMVGANDWLINLLLSGCGVLTVVLAAMAVRRRKRPDLALAVLLTAGLSAHLFVTSTCIQTDVLFACLVAAGLYGLARTVDGSPLWAVLGGAGLILGIFTRLAGIPLLAGAIIALLLTFRRPGYRWRVLAAALIAGVGAMAFWLWATRVRTLADAATGDYFAAVESHGASLFEPASLTLALQGLAHLPEATFSAITGQQLPSWIMALPMLAVVLGLVLLALRGEWVIVLPVVFYMVSLVGWGGGAVGRRYLLPVMPWLVYALFVAVAAIFSWFRRRRTSDATLPGRIAVIVVAAGCVAISLPKVAREIYWKHHPQFYHAFEHGRWQSCVDAASYLRQEGCPQTDQVIAPESSVVHALSGLRVVMVPLWEKKYPWNMTAIPPAAFTEAVVKNGARFVLVPKNVPPWSGEAMDRLAATGVFQPPREFERHTLYERLPPARPQGFNGGVGATGGRPG